jgi:hypothetical protein
MSRQTGAESPALPKRSISSGSLVLLKLCKIPIVTRRLLSWCPVASQSPTGRVCSRVTHRSTHLLHSTTERKISSYTFSFDSLANQG